MAYDPNDSGEGYIPPLKTYLDDVPVYDAELGGIVPAWKALVYHGAKARHFAQMRNDSAGAISEAAEKGAPSNQPKLPPPLVADAVEGGATDMARVLETITDLEMRLDALEERKRKLDEEAECARRAEAALALAESIAESAPTTLLDTLPPAPKQRLLN
jgi:hypothetical protein